MIYYMYVCFYCEYFMDVLFIFRFLYSGETVMFNGLKNRSGKSFDATARIENGKLKLLFDADATRTKES